jgi:MFS family permease
VISGSLSDRFGTRGLSILGLFIIAFGCLCVSTLNSEVGIAGYLVRLAPLGVGLGTFQSPNNSAIMGAAPPDRLGVASGLLSLTRTLGQTAGMPLMGAIFTHALMASTDMTSFSSIIDAPPEALVYGLTMTYRLGTIFITAATLATIAILWFLKNRMSNPGS